MAEPDAPQPCTKGPHCDGLMRHGWDCPQSNPLGDVLAMMADPLDNPLLERGRRAMLKDYGVEGDAPMSPEKYQNKIYQAAARLKQLMSKGRLVETEALAEVLEILEADLPVEVILFKPGGKYYTTDYWRVPPDVIGPYDMDKSPDFRRIGNGAVLVDDDRWGYPHLFPEEMNP